MRLSRPNKTSGRLASSARIELGPGRALRLLLSRALSSRLADFSMPPRRSGDKLINRQPQKGASPTTQCDHDSSG